MSELDSSDGDSEDEGQTGIVIVDNYDSINYDQESFASVESTHVKVKIGEKLKHLRSYKNKYYEGKNKEGKIVVIPKEVIRLEDPEYSTSVNLKATVVRPFKAKEDDEIDLKKGDIVTKIDKLDDDGWWEGCLNGATGSFPSKYVEVLPIKEPQLCEYEVRVHTGDVKGAGTDSNVFICLYGDHDCSETIPLLRSNNNDKFERNQVDIFGCIRPKKKLGHKLVGLKIWHDNALLGADWYLDRIDVLNKTDFASYTFVCRRWLALEEDDCNICRMLVLDDPKIQLRQLEIKQKMDTYYISLLTGRKGTDSNVFIELIGDYASTGEWPLRKNVNGIQDKFEKGQNDEFIIETVGLGKLKQVRIRSDFSSWDNSWHVESVTLNCPKMGFQYQCNFDILLTKKTTSEATKEVNIIKSYSPYIPYEITLTTANNGTTEPVKISIAGKRGVTPETNLALSVAQQKTILKAGETSVICLELPDIGEIEKVQLTHLGSKWHLDHLEIRMLDKSCKSKIYVFNCSNAKIGKKYQTSVDLTPIDVN